MSSEKQQPQLNPKGIYFYYNNNYIHPEEGETLKSFFKRCMINGLFYSTRFGDGRSQTGHMARRSPGDLLRIAETYFPETDFIDLAEVLRDMSREGMLNAGYCTGINRPVFYRTGTSYNEGQGFRNSYMDRRGNDKFSMLDVNEALGIV